MKTENGTLERTRTSRWRRRAFWLVVIGVPIVVAIAATWLYERDKYYEQLATILPGRIFEMHAEPEKRTYAPGENVVLNVSITYTAPPNATSAPFFWSRSVDMLEENGEHTAYGGLGIERFGPHSVVLRKRTGKYENVWQASPVILWPGDKLLFDFQVGPATESFRGRFFIAGEPYARFELVDLATIDDRDLLSNLITFEVVANGSSRPTNLPKASE